MRKQPKTTNDFVQVTRGYIVEMRQLAQRSPLAHTILWLFIERMNKTNAVVISQTAISEITDSHRVTVSKAVKLLSSENWIQVVKIGTSNAYVVNSKVIWTASNRTGKRYSVFNAEVVATETEQSTKELEAWNKLELKHVPVISNKETAIEGQEELTPPDQLGIDTGLDDIPLIKSNENG